MYYSRRSMENFKNAVIDYRYLRNKSYSDKSSLKLVGDRYSLTRIERNSLFRGVVSELTAKRRKAKIIQSFVLAGKNIAIDWYNVLISIETYLKGMPVFIADDGILRDVSGVHSSYKKGKVTEKAMNLIISEIIEFEVEKLFIYIDAPVAFSGEMAETLRRKLQTIKQQSITTVPSADYMLKIFNGIVCSSDFIIMDKAAEIFDFPRFVIEKNFDVKVPGLTSLKL